MNLFDKIRINIAKRQLNKALKIISMLSWEEIDEMFPRPNYTMSFNFKGVDWANVKLAYPNSTEKGEPRNEVSEV